MTCWTTFTREGFTIWATITRKLVAGFTFLNALIHIIGIGEFCCLFFFIFTKMVMIVNTFWAGFLVMKIATTIITMNTLI